MTQVEEVFTLNGCFLVLQDTIVGSLLFFFKWAIRHLVIAKQESTALISLYGNCIFSNAQSESIRAKLFA